jgi:hypothetical protein
MRATCYIPTRRRGWWDSETRIENPETPIKRPSHALTEHLAKRDVRSYRTRTISDLEAVHDRSETTPVRIGPASPLRFFYGAF